LEDTDEALVEGSRRAALAVSSSRVREEGLQGGRRRVSESSRAVVSLLVLRLEVFLVEEGGAGRETCRAASSRARRMRAF
jgi:hypothetical protein